MSNTTSPYFTRYQKKLRDQSLQNETQFNVIDNIKVQQKKIRINLVIEKLFDGFTKVENFERYLDRRLDEQKLGSISNDESFIKAMIHLSNKLKISEDKYYDIYMRYNPYQYYKSNQTVRELLSEVRTLENKTNEEKKLYLYKTCSLMEYTTTRLSNEIKFINTVFNKLQEFKTKCNSKLYEHFYNTIGKLHSELLINAPVSKLQDLILSLNRNYLEARAEINLRKT
jgi:hypothetical protein